MKMEHKCEKCNHKQDVEIPGIRQIIKWRWYWARYRVYRMIRRWTARGSMLCQSQWCLRTATWKIQHDSYESGPFRHMFSCDKHLEANVPDKTAEATSIKGDNERTRKWAPGIRSFVQDIELLLSSRDGLSCVRTFCFRQPVWWMGYVESGEHLAVSVCSSHLKKYDDIFYIRALKDCD